MYAYATVADVEAWTGQSYQSPAKVERLIRRASEIVDTYVTTSFDIDANGIATDAAYRDALRDATCAQVAKMIGEGGANATDDEGARPNLAALAWANLHAAGLL